MPGKERELLAKMRIENRQSSVGGVTNSDKKNGRGNSVALNNTSLNQTKSSVRPELGSYRAKTAQKYLPSTSLQLKKN